MRQAALEAFNKFSEPVIIRSKVKQFLAGCMVG